METSTLDCVRRSATSNPGYTCPNGFFISTIAHQYSIPEFEVTVDQEDKVIGIEYDFGMVVTGQSTVGSTIIPREYTRRQYMNFVHDFTFEIFSGSTDAKFSSVYPIKNDGKDLLSPDMILEVDDKKVVIEFATNRSAIQESLSRTAEIKAYKYEEAIRARCNQEPYYTDFFYIVTGPTGVFTNMGALSQEIADELVYRFKLARAIHHILLTKKLVIKDADEELSTNEKEAFGLFNSIELKFTDSDVFTKEFYAHCLSPSDSKLSGDLVGSAYREAKSRVRSSISEGGSLLSRDEIKIRNNNLFQLQKMNFYKSFKQDLDHHDTRYINSQIGIPFIVLKNDKFDSKPYVVNPDRWDAFPSSWFDCTDPYQKLWSDVLEKVHNGEVVLPSKDASMIYQDALDDLDLDDPDNNLGKEQTNIDRNKKFRVDVDMKVDDAVYFAKLGINKKKMRNLLPVKQYEEFKKRFYSIEHYTDDIEAMIRYPMEYFLSSEVGYEEDTYNHKDLIKQSVNIHKDVAFEEGLDSYDLFLESRMGKYCELVSDIGFELSLSLRQNVKPNQFIIKKLRAHNVFILIKPTNSSSHMFFSLMGKMSDIVYHSSSSVFKSLRNNGSIFWTEFHSYNSSKLINLNKCDSLMFNCLSFAFEQFQQEMQQSLARTVREETLNHMLGEEVVSSSPYSTFMVHLLVLLHDKHHVEEVITDYRYAFMESFVSFPLMPNIGKMFSKLNTSCRSRSHVYFTKKFIEGSERLSLNPPNYHNRDEEQQGFWSNLFDPWTGYALTNPQQMVNILYYGYLKNKDEQSEGNTRASLYKKILEYEDKMRDVNKMNLGMGSPLNPAFHEFNSNFLKTCCDTYSVDLRSNLGGDWKTRVGMDIRRALSMIDLEELSTLKASCGLDESSYSMLPKKYTRPKVFEKIVSDILPMAEGTNILHVMKPCLEKIENRGGYMHIDLFKKNQHGGEREIYVLGIEERVCQKIIETIANVLCKYSPSETMTNPKNKFNLVTSHSTTAKKMFGTEHVTKHVSADAMKWNQGHYVSKFAMMLVRLTPFEFHGFIFRACALWEKKKIFLNDRIMGLLRQANDLCTSNEYLNRMRSAFLGLTEERWMKKGQTYIQTESGMMQGILHYTSSLLHTIYLRFLNVNSRLLVEVDSDRKFTRNDILVTNLQSSDDSGVIMTIRVKNPMDHFEASIYIASIFYLKSLLGKHLAIYDSIKSTSNTELIFEFNSEYYFRSYLYRPTFRWVAASCQISEHENISSRQEEMSSLSTNILEGGGTMSLVHYCQIGQSRLFYRLMGLNINPVFSWYTSTLLKLMDPAMGFFLLDNPIIAGVAGFSYNLWNACCRTRLGMRYQHLYETLNLGDPSLEEFRAFTNTNTGTFVHSTNISFGQRKKWQSLVNRCGLPEDYYLYFDENPESLFRSAQDGFELQNKLSKKLHDPNVIESISKGNVTSRIAASSVYMISNNVISIKDTWVRTESLQQEYQSKKRSNLIKELDKAIKSIMTDNAETGMDLEIQRYLFPMSHDYKSINNTLKKFKRVGQVLKAGEPKKMRSYVQVTDMEKSLSSPMKICACKWLGKKWIHVSSTALDQMFQDLRERISFLRENIQDTLAASPFDHMHQLHNYLSRLELRPRMVRLTGSPLLSRGGQATLEHLITHDFSASYKLVIANEPMPEIDCEDSYKLAMHSLAMMRSLPVRKEKKMEVIDHIMMESEMISKSDYGNSNRAAYYVMQRFTKGLYGRQTMGILEDVRACRRGVIGGFTKVQSYNQITHKYVGDGIWTGSIDSLKIVLHFSEKNNRTQLKNIRVSDANIHDYIFSIRELLIELNIDNPKEGYGFATQRGVLYFLKNYSLNSSSGAPIYLDSTLEFHIDHTSYESIYTTITEAGNLALRGKLIRPNVSFKSEKWGKVGKPTPTMKKDVTHDVTLLNIRVRTCDANEHLNMTLLQDIKPFLRAWICNRPMSVDEIELMASATEPEHDFMVDHRLWLFERIKTYLANYRIVDFNLHDLIWDTNIVDPLNDHMGEDQQNEILRKYEELISIQRMHINEGTMDWNTEVQEIQALVPETMSDEDMLAFMGVEISLDQLSDVDYVRADDLNYDKVITFQHRITSLFADAIVKDVQDQVALSDFFNNKVISRRHEDYFNYIIKLFKLNGSEYEYRTNLDLSTRIKPKFKHFNLL